MDSIGYVCLSVYVIIIKEEVMNLKREYVVGTWEELEHREGSVLTGEILKTIKN